MSRKLIALVAVFGLAVAAVLAGTAWATRPAPKAGGCCYPGSDCCFPGSPCCEDDCCYEGSPCCYPGSPCCGDCCVEGAACCTEGAACCLTDVNAVAAPETRVGKEGCCKKAEAKKTAAKGCCGKGCCAVAVKADAGVTVIAVKDMECPSCAKKVIARLNEVPGVEKVVADTKASKLTVTPKAKAAPSAKAMWEAVEKAGFEPTRLTGPAGKFTASPKE